MDTALRNDGGAFTGAPYRTGSPPGLYEQLARPQRPRRVRLSTAAFVGLAERGPVNTPTLVTSMPAFRTQFGAAAGGMLLPQAVGAFFANGGRQCVVVRCLDAAKARTARLALPGLTADGAIAARNPGAWANRLSLRTTVKRRALPLRLAPVGDPAWPEGGLIAPAHRARPGVTLRLVGGSPPAGLVVRIAAAATPRRGVTAVTLDAALAPAFSDPALLAGAEELLVRLDVDLGGTLVERWDDAALHPDHPDFLPRLIGRRAASEALLAPRLSGGEEPDAAWGDQDDPAGSEFIRPSLLLRDAVLTPSAALLTAPDGLTFHALDLVAPDSGDDARATTTRDHFFDATPGEPGDAATGLLTFADRPGGLDVLAVWDETQPTDPIALVAMPDLLHPTPPDDAPEPALADDAPCFGACVHAPEPNASAVLPYPQLGASLDDLRTAQDRLTRHCEATGGRIALLDLPPGLAAGDIIGWRRALASGRAALFAPWLRAAPVGDPLGAAIVAPPSAAAAGLIARVEGQVGVWASPGAQTLAGVFGLAEDPGLPEAGFLHAERIDVIRKTEKGVQLMGSRTTALDPDWTHINVRRVIDWLKAQLALDLAWATFEPNNPALWRAMTHTATTRLRGLFDAGALAGDTAARSYFARCDDTTMSQRDLDQGRAIMLVGVAPAVPAEFLVFRLIRDGGENPSVGAFG
ncbi:hypothetical protein DDF62_14725 [Caulobacter radicis]|uniref:phage tail sheath C-terminal domain-containing protein n=1 Tax=Caulobacter radicis TaxID=2172650 RepID=UPI000D567C18|nr:phage tail sheath C-terminal domain-containing protein [Caulobacter radicis]PVM88445.1 hypothetical protein DDF62_14725 [Caulobacter radicis]